MDFKYNQIANINVVNDDKLNKDFLLFGMIPIFSIKKTASKISIVIFKKILVKYLQLLEFDCPCSEFLVLLNAIYIIVYFVRYKLFLNKYNLFLF